MRIQTIMQIVPGAFRKTRKRTLLALVVGIVVVAAGVVVVIERGRFIPAGPPPRSTEVVTPLGASSTIVLPIWADLTQLQRLLDREIPVALWQIDQPDATCAAPQQVKLFGAHVAITPKIKCHIIGQATRGAITLHGSGRDIIADVPILAHVEVHNIAGLVNTHADGQAMAHARIRINIARNWQASGTVALGYDWTTPPALTLLGQRIGFTSKADERLKPIIANLERKLPQALAGLDLRGQLNRLWQRGFTVISLNGRAPPVWMRLVPQNLSYGGYAIVGNRMQLRLGLEALTQATVGARPDNPVPAPLPDMTPAPVTDGTVRMIVPVIADYNQLVPVLARALARRSTRPFDLPGLGAVDAKFANVAIYGASQGRIAVGADVTAVQRAGVLPPVTGRIWFAGQPHNDPGSQVVHFTNLSVAGNQLRDRLLVAVANSPGFSDVIADALTQNFTHDYADLRGKIDRAVADRQEGDLHINAKIETVQNETLAAYANGLYMPVRLTGHAKITYQPKGAPAL